MTEISLSKKVSLYKAESIPRKTPISMAIEIAEIAKIAVFGNVKPHHSNDVHDEQHHREEVTKIHSTHFDFK